MTFCSTRALFNEPLQSDTCFTIYYYISKATTNINIPVTPFWVSFDELHKIMVQLSNFLPKLTPEPFDRYELSSKSVLTIVVDVEDVFLLFYFLTGYTIC